MLPVDTAGCQGVTCITNERKALLVFPITYCRILDRLKSEAVWG